MPASRRFTIRLWVAVVVSAIVQLATTAAVLHAHSAGLRLQRPGGRYSAPAFGPPAGTATTTAAGSGSGTAPVEPWLALALVVLALLGPALLIALRRAPGPVLAVVTAAAVAGTVLCASRDYGSPFYLSVLFAVAASSFLRARAWAWSCAGAYWLSFALAYLIAGDPLQLGWLVPLTIVSVGALAGPEFARTRRELRARFLQQAEARRAEEAQAERVRIARELHDVLAHSLSQINVQASVGLHLFETQPAKAAEALANVKETRKEALGEVRQVLGMLRGEEAPLAPEHGLGELRELVEGVRGQGVEAVLSIAVPDAARVPAAVQQAAYRIVQEGLTNVVRHAQARRVDVEVAVDASADSGRPRLRVTVVDDGVGSAPDGGAGGAGAATGLGAAGGRGLLGMRERAELLGGSFSAGPRSGGGFELAAELPLAGPA